MTALEFAARLSEAFAAAQHRYRTRRGMGAIVTPRVPDALLDEVANGLAPALLAAIDAAIDARLPTQPSTCDCGPLNEAGRR